MALVTVQRSPSVAGSNSDGEAEDDEGSKNEKSECFFAGKDTALSLALKEIPQQMERRLSTDSTRSTNSTQSNNSDIQQHLQSMFNLIRNEETLKMAVKLESQRPNRTRYLVIASRCCYRTPTTDRKAKVMRNNSMRSTLNTPFPTTALTSATSAGANQRHSIVDSGSNSNINSANNASKSHQLRQSQSEGGEGVERRERPSQTVSPAISTNRQSAKCDTDRSSASGDKCGEGIEESCLLGIDCNDRTTIGLVVPILADTTIHLDGDGGFSVTVYGKTHIFKPVSVQAMWSALQTLHKVSQKARENNFYPSGPSHDWLSYYDNRIESEQSCLNEWNAMDSLESRRPPSPDAIRNKPTAKEETESVIKMKLKEIMMSVDLDEVTSKYIRGRLEELLDMDLGEYKSFIDAEMLLILGQMDAPTKIFEHVYLGSEWNASNLEELQKNGVRHILNVTREIDNFFPGMFDYFNVRVYDDEKTNLLKHWDNTYRYITRAKSENSKVLVHCKMGVSRSASVVIAYAMKEYNWKFHQALQHVKDCRNCIKPNKNFLNQLETYNGMLDAMKNKEKLQRSKSETNLKSTKDARLLPGSEPTPLIQALNQSKSKSAGLGVSGDECAGVIADAGGGDLGMTSVGSSGVDGAGAVSHKQRNVIRRSSSTSPKSVQSQMTIVMKQQSQSLENLTPERSIADEPKNVRFPGSNGENYSVTQNQVLHIQKNTLATSTPPNSVRTIVHDLEACTDARKSVDDRKMLNLQFGRSVSQDTGAQMEVPHSGGLAGKALGSPVWTSSAKLITQTSNIASQSQNELLDLMPTPLRSSLRQRRVTSGSSSSDASDVFLSRLDKPPINDEADRKRHSRKTQSWAATSGVSGGIVMDVPSVIGSGSTKLGSNSSIDSASSAATTVSSSAASAAPYESLMRTRHVRHRDIPLRHASWGSGDNRYGLPVRNSSWSSYDTNRNNFQYNSAAAPAIVEGQIHELNMSNKTATSINVTSTSNRITSSAEGEENQQHHSHHLGTVKRTKQKLEEYSALKKLCQENGDLENSAMNQLLPDSDSFPLQKRNSNLYRSASAAGSIRSRYPHRCNSEEIMHSGTSISMLQRGATRRSDGSKPLQSELFSASAPESYSMADIENKNTLPPQESQQEDDDSAVVELRGAAMTAEDQRVSGNVQILKKSFEAKASVTSGSGLTQQSTAPKKGHQSLPSSPVAQHLDHSSQQVATTVVVARTAVSTTSPALTGSSSGSCDQQSKVNEPAVSTISSSTTTSSCSSSASSTSSSVSESSDRNVKGLVHKYQTTSATVAGTQTTTTTTSTTILAPIVAAFKPRPRSYYENQRTQKSMQSVKPHEFSDSRPPPAPAKSNAPNAHPHTHHHHTESILQQQQQQQPQRRLQQHGKTHPLARLSMTKQSCNAAAFNTM